MDCAKPDIELLLPDYYTGHLSADREQEVRSHLAECRSCREALRTMTEISGEHKPIFPKAEKRHFSPQLLGRYYSDPSSLDRVIVDQIEEHLKTCPECAADLNFFKDSHREFERLSQQMPAAQPRISLWSRLKRFFGKLGE